MNVDFTKGHGKPCPYKRAQFPANNIFLITMNFRIEKDSMGEMQVPETALYAAQTQRAVENFPVSGIPFPRTFIKALSAIKGACALVNADLGLLPQAKADAIRAASLEVSSGAHDDQFPIDIFQTGSGTSTNMNANEVLASLSSTKLGENRSSQRRREQRPIEQRRDSNRDSRGRVHGNRG
jgi:fumarate hydratase class II